jgi:hypothetical protein
MADTTPTIYMGLPNPNPGVATGPAWATDLYNSLVLVDAHDHTSGSGRQITPDGLNISSTLPLNNQLLTGAKAYTMAVQGSLLPGTGSTVGALYVNGVDLYYNDISGNQVRITQSGGVAGSPGSISGLISPASASYNPGSTKFVWQSDANVAARLDCGSIFMRNATAGSNALLLNPPTAMGANYSLTLPSLPVSTKIMTLDATGAMAGAYMLDNSTINLLGGGTTIQVANFGITSLQLANNSVTASAIANNAVTTSAIASNAVTGAKIGTLANGVNTINIVDGAVTSAKVQSSINLPGTPTAASRAIVSSYASTPGPQLGMIRGRVQANGVAIGGEGFTSVPNSTGNYTVTWNTAFSDVPSVVATSLSAGTYMVNAAVTGSGSANVTCYDASTLAPVNLAFQFVAVGIRAS